MKIKQLRKLLFTLVLAFVTVFAFGASSVSASAPNKITVQRAQTLEDLVTNYKYGFVIFTTNDGKIIYCVDPDKKGLKTGMTATFSKDGDAGLLYLLQNGYPNKQITGNDEIDKYVTQAAVWWYMDESGQAGKFPDSFKNATSETDEYGLIPNYIKPMVAKAKAAKDTQVKPNIKLVSDSNKFVLSEDGKYYESVYMSANVTGASTYNVKVNGATANTVVVAENGSIGTTFNSGAKFKVRVPVAEVNSNKNIAVKVSASGNVKKAKIFAPSDQATYQRVAGLYDDEVTVNDSISLSLNTGKHICEFTDNKYYGKDGKEVDKKTYNKECNRSCEYENGKYYGKDGSEVDKKTYDKECGHYCEVVNGKHYGKNGKEVDQNTYNKECGQEVVVPNTSANIIFWIVGLGVLAVIIGTSFLIVASNKKTEK